jgi:hypothetical protein
VEMTAHCSHPTGVYAIQTMMLLEIGAGDRLVHRMRRSNWS